MKKIIEAYIPFLIYSIIIFVFYFFQQYYFPKYSLVLALLSAPIYVLYLLIGTFVFSYFLGKTVQKGSQIQILEFVLFWLSSLL